MGQADHANLPVLLGGAPFSRRTERRTRARGDPTPIGDDLHMSAATAKTHVSRILTKLGARDRSQLVVIADKTGLASAH